MRQAPLVSAAEPFQASHQPLLTPCSRRDQGPYARCVGPDVPPPQEFQHPLPPPPKELADMDEARPEGVGGGEDQQALRRHALPRPGTRLLAPTRITLKSPRSPLRRLDLRPTLPPPFRCGVTSWRCWNPRVPPSPPTLCPRAAPPTRPCSPPWRGSVPRRSGKRGRDPSAQLPRPGAASGTPPLHVRLTPCASKPGLPLPLQADGLRWRLQRRAHSLCTDQGGSLRGVLPRHCGGRRQG